MKTKLKYILVFFLIAGCEAEGPGPNYEYLVFRNCYPINIPSYSYIGEEGFTWQISGDSLLPAESDTVSSQPVFIWQNPGASLLMVAVFRNPIEVQEGTIVNVDDIVWQWHSGMLSEKPDTVSFSEGGTVTVHNGIVNYGPFPGPLDTLTDYYWAVWGWGHTATRIVYSSRQMKFHVSD